ncbi:MAG: CHAD domain-containing protein [Sphaerochaeta sp.]|uniref:CHAD domain-containing protein n=1 Tax=Sphaerochaeta sp. TaxID=1972642 RepID=UPI003D0E8041
MSKSESIYLLVGKTLTLDDWAQAFLPFTIAWDHTELYEQGVLSDPQLDAVAILRYYPEEKRMELYPQQGKSECLEQVLQAKALRELVSGPVTIFARKQLALLQDQSQILLDMDRLHDWRVALRKILTILALLTRGMEKEERQRFTRSLCALFKQSGKLRDHQVLEGLYAQYGLASFFPVKKRNVLVRDLQSMLSGDMFVQLEEVIDASALALSAFEPQRLVDVSFQAMVRAMHQVHSARDIKAMHSVRKRIKTLRHANELAGLGKREDLVQLQDALGAWHDRIMMQDRLQKCKKPPLVVKKALIELDLAIDALVQTYRQLSKTYWEEQR